MITITNTQIEHYLTCVRWSIGSSPSTTQPLHQPWSNMATKTLQSMSWNIPAGASTPDPALLSDPATPPSVWFKKHCHPQFITEHPQWHANTGSCYWPIQQLHPPWSNWYLHCFSWSYSSGLLSYCLQHLPSIQCHLHQGESQISCVSRLLEQKEQNVALQKGGCKVAHVTTHSFLP